METDFMSTMKNELLQAVDFALNGDWDAAHRLVQNHEGDVYGFVPLKQIWKSIPVCITRGQVERKLVVGDGKARIWMSKTRCSPEVTLEIHAW